MIIPKCLYLSIACLLVTTIIGASNARADWLHVNPLVRHITSQNGGTAGVVILPDTTANSGPAGLLFYSTKKSISAQAFAPKNLSPKDAHIFFLRFDRKLRRFSELVIVGGKTFALNGNITLETDTMRVSLINDGDKDAYTSVLYKGDKSIISFLGLQSIASSDSPTMVQWLDASTTSTSEIFSVDGQQQLLVGGASYVSEKVGLPSQNTSQSICANNGVIFTSGSSHRKAKDFLQKNTIILTKKEGLVVQDGYGQLLSVTPLKERSPDDTIICMYEPLA